MMKKIVYGAHSMSIYVKTKSIVLVIDRSHQEKEPRAVAIDQEVLRLDVAVQHTVRVAEGDGAEHLVPVTNPKSQAAQR